MLTVQIASVQNGIRILHQRASATKASLWLVQDFARVESIVEDMDAFLKEHPLVDSSLPCHVRLLGFDNQQLNLNVHVRPQHTPHPPIQFTRPTPIPLPPRPPSPGPPTSLHRRGPMLADMGLVAGACLCLRW